MVAEKAELGCAPARCSRSGRRCARELRPTVLGLDSVLVACTNGYGRARTRPGVLMISPDAVATLEAIPSCEANGRLSPSGRFPGSKPSEGVAAGSCLTSAMEPARARRSYPPLPIHRPDSMSSTPQATSPPNRCGLVRIGASNSLEFPRESVVVVIPIFASYDVFVSCLRSVLRHTPEGVPILVADDASPDPRSARFLEELNRSGVLRHQVLYVRQEHNVGFVHNVNTAFELTRPADVVVLNSDCQVGPRWIENLRDAAYSDSAVATATALTNHGTLLSVPNRNQPLRSLPAHMDIDDIAQAVEQLSPKLRPRIPTAIGHCFYVRRSALDLVGGFDEAFSPGYGEEVDFSQRCILSGLIHVAADDVFVFHQGGGTFPRDGLQESHEQIIKSRYPYYHPTVAAAGRRAVGPLARSLSAARVAIQGLSVTIDARCLGPVITGTQVHIMELVHALARTGQVRLRCVVPSDTHAWYRESLSRLDEVDVLSAEEVSPATPPTAIVHRPYQVFDVSELASLAQLGERLVVTHQDLISYRNPGYAASFVAWDELRRLTRLTLALADYVLFFSHHAAQDARADDLVDERRSRVVHLGVDHRAGGEKPRPERPLRLSIDAEADFLLCLGTDFRHKNRVFVLRVLHELQRRHDWSGYVVFAGPHAAAGTSAADEAAFLTLHPSVAERTLDLHAVPEPEKAWLLANTRGVVYPTVYEGFGLIPFEAADYNVPCFFAHVTALAELLPPEAAAILQWDAAATADNIARLLTDDTSKRELIAHIRAAAAPLTWDRTAGSVVEVYRRAIQDPFRDVASLADSSMLPARIVSQLHALQLNDLDIPPDVYRALWAFAGRPALRAPFFGAMRTAYRVGFALKHRR